MTIGELINYLNIYGGDYFVEPTGQMISIINLALREFYLNTPVTRTVSFNVRDHKPTVSYKNIVCKSGESISFPISGICYSMRVTGKGNYVMEDTEKAVGLQFDTGNDTKVIRGFFKDSGTITFFADFTFVIHELATFDEAFGREVSTIPDLSPIKVFNLREMYPDFFSLVSPPTNGQGEAIEGCRVRDGRIEFDSSYSGEVFITYRRLPTEITYYYDEDEVSSSEVVDISEEYTIPLIYLIWYCYWCHTDETKAKGYKDSFDRVMADVRSASFSLDTKYAIKDGWA